MRRSVTRSPKSQDALCGLTDPGPQHREVDEFGCARTDTSAEPPGLVQRGTTGRVSCSLVGEEAQNGR